MASVSLKCRKCEQGMYLHHPMKGKAATVSLLALSGWTFATDTGWLCNDPNCIASGGADASPQEKLIESKETE